MKVETIDLYKYFNVNKQNGCQGILTCYVHDLSNEINPLRKNPAMLVIPGGGYVFCSEREGEPIALRYFAFGFNSFTLSYTISISPSYPYPLLEAVMAMNYIRINADYLHIDPNMVSAIGFSAWGHLCGMLGSFSDSDDMCGFFKSKVSARPDAIVLSYPVISCACKTHMGSFNQLCGEENFELMNKLDITNLVNKNSSPAFIWSTYDDGAVPVVNAIVVAEAYEKNGVPFSLHIWGKGCHGLSCADSTVYNSNFNVKEISSASVAKWIELSIEWLAEMGISIKD